MCIITSIIKRELSRSPPSLLKTKSVFKALFANTYPQHIKWFLRALIPELYYFAVIQFVHELYFIVLKPSFSHLWNRDNNNNTYGTELFWRLHWTGLQSILHRAWHIINFQMWSIIITIVIVVSFTIIGLNFTQVFI